MTNDSENEKKSRHPRKGDRVEFSIQSTGTQLAGDVEWVSSSHPEHFSLQGLEEVFTTGHSDGTTRVEDLVYIYMARAVGDYVGPDEGQRLPAGTVTVDAGGDVAIKLDLKIDGVAQWARIYPTTTDGVPALATVGQLLRRHPGGTIVHLPGA